MLGLKIEFIEQLFSFAFEKHLEGPHPGCYRVKLLSHRSAQVCNKVFQLSFTEVNKGISWYQSLHSHFNKQKRGRKGRREVWIPSSSPPPHTLCIGSKSMISVYRGVVCCILMHGADCAGPVGQMQPKETLLHSSFVQLLAQKSKLVE